MFDKAARLTLSARLARKAARFGSEERGSITLFVLLIFVLMVLFGGIAVDIMRSEMRRVTYQQTFDRAALAASNVVLPPSQTPTTIAQQWYNTAGLGDKHTVDFGAPVITGLATAASRETRIDGTVRSYNWFMNGLNVPYFNIPVSSRAIQGISKIEVILALDITGSMAEPSGNTTKIAALRTAAENFVNILKFNLNAQGQPISLKANADLISIGLVPYSSNVNIPAALRNQFNYTNLSWWDGQPNQGVQAPQINCFEIPPSTFAATALSNATTIPMAAVAHTGSSNPGVAITQVTGNTTGGIVNLGRTGAPPGLPTKNTTDVYCNHGDNFNTPADESNSNLLLLPTTETTGLISQIRLLNPRGTTSIAVGMRWATALMDQSARPIYSLLRASEPAMAGRPANNTDNDTRKIIVLMTDGTHVASRHIVDAYKTGPSPIYRGADGNVAIRFTTGGPALTGGTRPGIAPTGNPVNSCSGWSLADTVVNGIGVRRDFFVPHLKRNSVAQRRTVAELEGQGTGTSVTGACDPLAWVAGTGTPLLPAWQGSGVVRQLDWSEVWRYMTVDWMIEQLYLRSNVSSATNYTTVYNTFVGNFLTNEATMDGLLNTNCNAAKAAGFEVFGIILGDNVTETPIRNCSSPGTGYYYKTTDPASLNAAFAQIAVLISDLRLTQ